MNARARPQPLDVFVEREGVKRASIVVLQTAGRPITEVLGMIHHFAEGHVVEAIACSRMINLDPVFLGLADQAPTFLWRGGLNRFAATEKLHPFVCGSGGRQAAFPPWKDFD